MERDFSIFNIEEQLKAPILRFNPTIEAVSTCVKKWNHETNKWETIQGDETSGNVVYLLNKIDNPPTPKCNIFKAFWNSV